MTAPISTKPYILRAIYEWCVENGYTPYISVIVDANTRVPQEHVRNGEIVLNIGPLAANRVKLGNELIEFAARFGGAARELVVPLSQVKAIYARENGHGISFEVDPTRTAGEASGAQFSQREPNHDSPPPSGGGKPGLRLVK